MQLAKRGVSVLLVSRTQQRLDDTAAEIKAACPSVETATLQFDFSSATEADYARLAKAVVGKDIGVLYNNVGISYSYAQFLEQLPDDRVDAIVEMNMRAMVKCTKLVLPGARQGSSARFSPTSLRPSEGVLSIRTAQCVLRMLACASSSALRHA